MGTKSSIDQLNSFLRGEMSAVETYRMALDKLDKTSIARDELLINLKSHEDRVIALKDAIIAIGGTPAKGSGPWGAFAKAVTGSAKLFGNTAALKALKEGEEHGLKEYQDALEDGKLPADCRELIQGFLGKQRQHITAIDNTHAVLPQCV